MRTARLLLACVAAATVVCLAPASARAADVAPGERVIRLDPDDGTRPYDAAEDPVAGEVLATMVVPFEVDDGRPPAERDFSRGTLTSRVIREPGRPGLTFDYRLDQTEVRGVIDMEDNTLAAFNGFTTDVRTGTTTRSDAVQYVERSADGNQVRLGYNIEDLEEYLIVRTDAPAYATGGTFAAHWDIESSPENPFGTEVLATFRPVPEPGGVAVVMALGAHLLRRRRGRTGA